MTLVVCVLSTTLLFQNRYVFAQEAYSECVKVMVGSPNLSITPNPTGYCNEAVGSVGGKGACEPAPTKYDDVLLTTAPQYINAIKKEFDIQFTGAMQYNDVLAKWMWEEYWSIKCYKFLEFMKGMEIEGIDTADKGSVQLRCPNQVAPHIQYNNYSYSESEAKELIIHEMTHAYQNCADEGIQNRAGMAEARVGTEPGNEGDASRGYGGSFGSIAPYPRTYFEGSYCIRNADGTPLNIDKDNEEHAETISLHMNPQTYPATCGDEGDPNPYSLDGGEAFPAHKKLATQGVGAGPTSGGSVPKGVGPLP